MAWTRLQPGLVWPNSAQAMSVSASVSQYRLPNR